MNQETFFERFDQFADAPGAVAKMRMLVLNLAISGKLLGQSKATDSPSSSHWEQFPLTKFMKPGLASINPERFPDTIFFLWSVPAFPTGMPEMVYGRDIGSTKKVISPGDLLLSKINPHLNRVWLTFDTGDETHIASSEWIVLEPDGIEPRLLQAFLRSGVFLDQYCSRLTGIGGSLTRVRPADAGKYTVPVPSPRDQLETLAFVDELMALCDELEAQQQERETQHAALAQASLARFADAPTPANLEFIFHPSYTVSPADLRKSILSLAVQGKLVPQDPNDESASELLQRLAHELTPEQRRRQAVPLSPLQAESRQYEVPDSWIWARFRDVAIIASNLVKPQNFLDFTHLAPDNIEKGSGLLLRCRTVQEDKVISSNHRFYPGQIVYSKIRPNLAKVVVVDFDGLCSADMYPIDALIDVFYLQLYMLSESFLVQAVKADTRVAMPKINQTELNAIAVPLPPLAEQRRIVAKVDELMALVDQLEAQLASAQETGADLVEAVVAELAGKA